MIWWGVGGGGNEVGGILSINSKAFWRLLKLKLQLPTTLRLWTLKLITMSFKVFTELSNQKIKHIEAVGPCK